MSRIQGGWRRNSLERAVHEWLVAEGVNHRMNPRRTPGHPDVVVYGTSSGRRLHIFVDGCFWHACPIHYRRPKSRTWPHDLEAEERAREARRAGLPFPWVRIWEHEVRSGSFADTLRFAFERYLGAGR